jgi:hypothetical protein
MLLVLALVAAAGGMVGLSLLISRLLFGRFDPVGICDINPDVEHAYLPGECRNWRRR